MSSFKWLLSVILGSQRKTNFGIKICQTNDFRENRNHNAKICDSGKNSIGFFKIVLNLLH